jgi:holo-ACP synthase / triphosphoribosyl-dephospho-CoA synthase
LLQISIDFGKVKLDTESKKEIMSKLLEERELRVILQQQLLQTYPYPLAVVKANMPGEDKRSLIQTIAVCEGYFELMKLKTKNVHYSYTIEGLIFFLSIDLSVEQLKNFCVDIEENHPLGRLMDIDVMNIRQQISRRNLDLSPRRCFLCDEEAHVCVREQMHAMDEIEDFILNAFKNYLFSNDSYTRWQRMIQTALIGELIKPLGYGCVTLDDVGSHSDMNALLFIQSAHIVSTEIALAHAFSDDFNRLREVGKVAEKKMFERTHGVNTHKGAIFLMLLVMAGLQHPDPVSHISFLCKDILADFESDDQSHGMKLFRQQGITGIRGLAKDGFSDLFNKYYPYFQSHSIDDTFLSLIGENPDTTLMYRGGMSLYNECREKAQKAEKMSDRAAFDGWMKMQRLSPGGSADMLSAILLIDLTLWNMEETNDEPTRKNRYRRYLGIE